MFQGVVQKFVFFVSLKESEFFKRPYINLFLTGRMVYKYRFNRQMTGQRGQFPVRAIKAQQAVIIADVDHSVSPLCDSPVLIPGVIVMSCVVKSRRNKGYVLRETCLEGAYRNEQQRKLFDKKKFHIFRA